MQVYLDNAATTPILSEVVDAMCENLKNTFGNPSSTHSFGRKSKSVIELSRRSIASILHCQPSEIIFTSGGTEADNMVLHLACDLLKVKQIISSPIEHHAVEHTALDVAKKNGILINWVKVDNKGNVDLSHLEELLQKEPSTLVSLMHANNEIGTLLPIQKVAEICKKYKAYFHSDTVQTMGHYRFDLQSIPIDFVTCSAHKIHGPKGIGFIYINKRIGHYSFIQGGSQERGFRSGTENLAGIIGLKTCFVLANKEVEQHQKDIQELKSYFIDGLNKNVPNVYFNGEISPEKSLYTVLNCSFPALENPTMLQMLLDLKGIACSGGSACSSGANTGSHVLKAIKADLNRANIRFSFSRFTTKKEIDYTIQTLKEIFENIEK
ncbi:MAG: cysteine desulfurase [Flavobacteriia bacterium]|nr:cysteine desulfurase [Flavobacteriia bacterium]